MKPHEFSLARIPSISSAWTEMESGQREARMSAQADRSEARIVLTVNSMAEHHSKPAGLKRALEHLSARHDRFALLLDLAGHLIRIAHLESRQKQFDRQRA